MKVRGILKPGVPSEEQEQIVLTQWLNLMGVRFCASANGGTRHMLEAVKLKRMGVSAGFPDITIPYARNGHHGLYIELKNTSGGKVSEHQKDWLSFLQEQGYLAVVCKGATAAIEVVSAYFGDEFGR